MVLVGMDMWVWYIIAVRGAPTTLTVEGVRGFLVSRGNCRVLSHITP